MKISLFEIFITFFKIGVQLIGGGYVILPLLKKYVVEDKKWLKEEELVDYLALSQCLPGIIALNISIFSGYNLRKIKGSIIAILGLLCPSFIIILLIAGFISNISDYQPVKNAFFGVRISVMILVFSMIYDIFKKSFHSIFPIFLFLLFLSGLFIFNLSPTVLILSAVILALIKGWVKK